MRLDRTNQSKVKILAIILTVSCLTLSTISLFSERSSADDMTNDLQAGLLVLDQNVNIDNLTFSTYMCGSGNDVGSAVSFDADNNMYILGSTSSTDFPVKNAYQNEIAGESDLFIIKLSPGGNIIYSTYFGGSGHDSGKSIAVDTDGNVFITGLTTSTDFPLLNAFQSTLGGGYDAFVLKTNPDGEPIYSTYVGGDNEDIGTSIAVDSGGNAVICGYTSSTDFPVVYAPQENCSGDSDAFVVRLDAIGAPIFSTYIGGAVDDFAYDVFLDTAGYIFIAGATYSEDFPLVDAFQDTKKVGDWDAYGGSDAFILEMCPIGCLEYSTFLGGKGPDSAQSLAVDLDGNIYLTGYTYSDDFPTVNATQNILAGEMDIFITKMNVSGTALDFSTYYGGSGWNLLGWDHAFSLALDGSGNIYVAGYSGSTTFPVVNAYQESNNGDGDAILIKLTNDGEPIFASFYGGSEEDICYGMSILPNGNVCMVGSTWSSDFPMVNPCHDSLNGQNGAFISILGEMAIEEDEEGGDGTTTFVIIAIMVVVIVIVAAFLIFRRRPS